jgi:hypothetical protein
LLEESLVSHFFLNFEFEFFFSLFLLSLFNFGFLLSQSHLGLHNSFLLLLDLFILLFFGSFLLGFKLFSFNSLLFLDLVGFISFFLGLGFCE